MRYRREYRGSGHGTSIVGLDDAKIAGNFEAKSEW